MAKSFPKRNADEPAQSGPGDADGPESPTGDAGSADAAGNADLGSLPPVSRGRRKPSASRLRTQLDALFRDTAAAAEAARRWSDGPGRLWRLGLPPQPGAAAALAHLQVHTGLMQVMNWLLDPAHHGPVSGLRPFDHPPYPPLASDHPLRASEGLAIADAARALHARAAALAAAHPLADAPPDDLP